MLDGACPQRTAEVFNFLQATSEIGSLPWTPYYSIHYSPDLNPCGYFLWSYLNNRVFKDTPATFQDFRTAISREIRAVENGVVQKLIMEFS